MKCQTHGTEMPMVCGEPVCGMCFMDTVMGTPVREARRHAPAPYEYRQVPDPHGGMHWRAVEVTEAEARKARPR